MRLKIIIQLINQNKILCFLFLRDFSLGGDYRYIVVKPNEVTYEIIEYNDKTSELSKSDWDFIKPQEKDNAENGKHGKGIL